ncbi:hypothetical protein P691DRAFT_549706 [Macrolepiota fuliginosa MF-IS2]|uniref:Uncharacterized protein n=1 Tax=Macrolepiota fuliginosa MF-IS2 TaxID=1400762 RepID=A0A9P5XHV3_9AGAR|nr:hypothetical protein P691DRAFT_549706 [Macrolepiota fuliginosa MF-IS2]
MPLSASTTGRSMPTPSATPAIISDRRHIPSIPDSNTPNATPASVLTTPTRLLAIHDECDLRAGDRNDIRPMETQEELHLREFGVLREERLSGGTPDVKARSFPGGSHAEGSVEFPSASAPPTRRGGPIVQVGWYARPTFCRVLRGQHPTTLY